MNSKTIEYFQQEQISNKDVTLIDNNYIILNRTIKYILNLLLIYLFVSVSLYNFPELDNQLLIILICVYSSVVFYILDLNFPSCNI